MSNTVHMVSLNRIQTKQTFISRANSFAMTAVLTTWADCWAVTGLPEDLTGEQALFRTHVTHYTSSLLAGTHNHKVNHIKQITKWHHCRWLTVWSKFTNCLLSKHTRYNTKDINMAWLLLSLILFTEVHYKLVLSAVTLTDLRPKCKIKNHSTVCAKG